MVCRTRSSHGCLSDLKNKKRYIGRVSRTIRNPSIRDLVLFANSPTCYNVEAKTGAGEQWTTPIYYGEPGGSIVQSSIYDLKVV